MFFLPRVIDLAEVRDCFKQSLQFPAIQDKVENPSSWDNAFYPRCNEKNGYSMTQLSASVSGTNTDSFAVLGICAKYYVHAFYIVISIVQ